jgi:hypothetical protein
MPSLKAYGQEIGGEMTPEVKWFIEAETLHISGTGIVPTTMFGKQSPWHPYRSKFNAVVIDEGIIELGKLVFNGYKNITSLTVAGSVESLGGNAFSFCPKLATIEIKSAIPPNISFGTFAALKTKNVKLIVPDGCMAEYKDTPFWNTFGTIEESGQAAVNADKISRKLNAPCTVRVYREPRTKGGAEELLVYLNGTEQGILENGKTVEMETDRVRNKIVIKSRKSDLKYFCFDALSGGEIQINYSAATGNIKIVDE